MVLRGPGGQVVPSSTAYDTGTRTATLTPSIDLGVLHDLHGRGQRRAGRGRQHDGAGDVVVPDLGASATRRSRTGRAGRSRWSPAPRNPSSSYLAEILRAEGLNEFANVRVSTLTATTLAPYAVVVLGDVALTDAQVTALTDWVNAGGNLDR